MDEPSSAVFDAMDVGKELSFEIGGSVCKKADSIVCTNLKCNELNYLTKAIETEWVSTAGPFIHEFEQAVPAT